MLQFLFFFFFDAYAENYVNAVNTKPKRGGLKTKIKWWLCNRSKNHLARHTNIKSERVFCCRHWQLFLFDLFWHLPSQEREKWKWNFSNWFFTGEQRNPIRIDITWSPRFDRASINKYSYVDIRYNHPISSFCHDVNSWKSFLIFYRVNKRTPQGPLKRGSRIAWW